MGALYLIDLDFAGGRLRVTNFPLDVTAMGHPWTGVGMLGEVGQLQESEDGNYQKVRLTLTQVQSSILALAMGSAETYQDRDAIVYVALFDQTFQIQGAPVRRFAGKMENVSIAERDDKGMGKIHLDLQAGAYNVRTNPAALRMNHAQHVARHPGETGFRYVPTLIGQPRQWLSARFQRV
ncbi:hypothetical protein ASG30_09180 [Ramlibacter sp. Leaf400]|nr:hypothetical protein ASG30_09180 [Ramlibacter sp. Leaf400]